MRGAVAEGHSVLELGGSGGGGRRETETHSEREIRVE